MTALEVDNLVDLKSRVAQANSLLSIAFTQSLAARGKKALEVTKFDPKTKTLKVILIDG